MKWTNLLKETILQNSQKEKDNLIRPISIKEMKSIINNLPKQKVPGSDGLTNIVSILYNIFQKIEIKGRLPHPMRPTLP